MHKQSQKAMNLFVVVPVLEKVNSGVPACKWTGGNGTVYAVLHETSIPVVCINPSDVLIPIMPVRSLILLYRAIIVIYCAGSSKEFLSRDIIVDFYKGRPKGI